MLFLISLCFYY